MLRICIPVHNEATTIGVLLWRLRSVFQGFSREYDVTVYDDASTDGTGEVLEPYQSVMPLTVLRGTKHVGYAGSIDALVRHVAADDEYARRDAMVLLQGDFTESPEHLPELVKRFEGGADLVAVHRITSADTPADERRLRRWGPLGREAVPAHAAGGRSLHGLPAGPDCRVARSPQGHGQSPRLRR